MERKAYCRWCGKEMKPDDRYEVDFRVSHQTPSHTIVLYADCLFTCSSKCAYEVARLEAETHLAQEAR